MPLRAGVNGLGTTIPTVAALMRATPQKKSALALLHSDACAAAILRNELDAGFLQGDHQRGARFGPTADVTFCRLQPFDRGDGDTGFVRQIILRPTDQRSSRFNLSNRYF